MAEEEVGGVGGVCGRGDFVFGEFVEECVGGL